jgi:hypothetical protein
MRYIGGQVGKLNKYIMLVGILVLSHGFVLLGGNFHNHDEPMSGELVMLKVIGDPIHFSMARPRFFIGWH